MDHYSEQIRIREQSEKAAAGQAETYLLGKDRGDSSCPGGETDEMMAALEYLFRRFRLPFDMGQKYETVPELLDCVLEPAGILYEEIDTEKELAKRKSEYVLAFSESGDCLVLPPSVSGRLFVIPSRKKRGILTSAIRLQPKAYVISRPLPEGKLTFLSFLKYVFTLMSPGSYALIAVCSFLVARLGTFVPRLNRLILGDYIRMPMESAGSLLANACITLAAVSALRALFGFLKKVLTSFLSTDVDRKVESAFMARILLKPMQFFRDSTSGKISSHIQYCKKLSEIATGTIAGASLTAVFSLVYLGEIAGISAAMLSVSLLILLARLLFTAIFNYLSRENNREIVENEIRLRDYNNMIFKGISKLKTSGALTRVYTGWARLYRTSLRLAFSPPMLLRLKPALKLLLSAGGTVVLLLTAASCGLSGADYIAFLSVFGMLTNAADQIAVLSTKAATAMPYIEKLRSVTDSAKPSESGNRKYVKELYGAVRFDRVCFHYEGNEHFAIRDLSLTVRPGEKIAIVGKSGSGKSSLVNLLTGLNTPDSGEIYIDGKPLSHINQRSLCRQIGSVSQFSRLFPATVRFNVSLGDDSISDEEIWEALENAAIADTIRSYPLGLDTEISEGTGCGLSKGQQQRILLARSFAGGRRIILLDEATSALDNTTQKKVLNSIYEMNATVIMVAHRLSTVTRCSRIYVMEDGKITEEGTYKELLANHGPFYALVKKQLEGTGFTGEEKKDDNEK